MISPSVYLLISYFLTVVFVVSVYSVTQADGSRRVLLVLTTVLLLACDLFALFGSIDALIMMDCFSWSIFGTGLIGSSIVTVLFMREWESVGLRISSVVTTVGFFLLFLLLLIPVLPEFRYCLGCEEWH